MRKHGYAPFQHVFGCDLRFPQGLLDDRPNIAFQSGVHHGDETLARANEIRMAARKALLEADDDQKVRRALSHRQRTMRDQELAVGDLVYYWRRYRNDGKAGMWRGPGRVIGFFSGRSKIWISVGNKVLRCAPEQLRRLTVDQEAAIKFVTEDMIGARRQLSERGAHVFTDISQDGAPPVEEGINEEPSAKRVRIEEPVRENAEESEGYPSPSEPPEAMHETEEDVFRPRLRVRMK